jgi:hypothetical protein
MNAFADTASALDPVVLARRLNIELEDWQAAAVRSTHRQQLLLCARQSGKSLAAAVRVLHIALYTPGSLCLITSASQRQAVNCFRTVASWYALLGRPVPPESENTLSLRLENGSRIVALPGDPKTVRGYSAADLVVIDEAAFCEPELFYAMMPMTAVSNGVMMIMSTPMGKRGFFWEASQSEEWERFVVPADQCPRISPEFLAAQRRMMGDWRFRQEFECEFVSGAGSYFDPADIDALLGDDFPVLELA